MLQVLPRRVGAALASILTTFTAPAFAEPKDEEEEELTLPGGALVLELGAGPLIGGASGTVGALGGWAPIVSGGFEARLIPRLWLVGQVRGALSRSHLDHGGADDTVTDWSAGVDVGIRHVLTDPEPLEVSWQLVASGQYGEGTSSAYEAQAWNAGLQAGLVLQHHFTDWLAIRARLDLLEAGYGESSYRQYGEPGTSRSDRWSAAITAEPTLGMRFGF